MLSGCYQGRGCLPGRSVKIKKKRCRNVSPSSGFSTGPGEMTWWAKFGPRFIRDLVDDMCHTVSVTVGTLYTWSMKCILL